MKPGGMFVNVEHTASATAELEQLHDALFVDHLAAYNNRPRAEVEEEYENRPDKADNILENVFVQVDWLRQIGFGHADCYFKWLALQQLLLLITFWLLRRLHFIGPAIFPTATTVARSVFKSRGNLDYHNSRSYPVPPSDTDSKIVLGFCGILFVSAFSALISSFSGCGVY